MITQIEVEQVLGIVVFLKCTLILHSIFKIRLENEGLFSTAKSRKLDLAVKNNTQKCIARSTYIDLAVKNMLHKCTIR